jgi:hypothetical protein
MMLSPKTYLGAGTSAVLLGMAIFVFSARVLGAAGAQTMEYRTPLVKVAGIYPSMLGPTNTDLNVTLTKADQPELLWVTGYRADMVGPRDNESRSSEFMCHNTLSIHDTVDAHAKVLGSGFYQTRRLFTLSQGQSGLDFPPGFGIPVSSAERFMLQSQVLNLRQDRIGSEVRHRVQTKFVSDRDAGRPMQALTLIDFGIALEVVDQQAREMPSDPLSCADDAGGQPTVHLGDKEMTAHWMVKPGKEKRVTKLRRPFKFNTKLHYISVHLHGYAESLELWDMTANKSVYKALCKPTEDKQGLAEVGHFSSAQGLPVYSDHQYQLISHYNNVSGKEQTAMAFMFCYAADPSFKKPKPLELAQRSDEYCSKIPVAAPPVAAPPAASSP